VILFSQLTDKSLLKEHFPDSQPLPEYKKAVDLLTPYLNPDIAALKQQLTACGDDTIATDLLSQAVDNSRQPLFEAKTLEQIQAMQLLPEQAFTGDLSVPGYGGDGLIQESLGLDSGFDNPGSGQLSDNNFSENIADSDNTDTAQQELYQQTLSGNPDAAFSSEQPLTMPENEPGLSEEQIALVHLAEQEFSPIQFTYSPQGFPGKLCRLDARQFNEYRQTDGDYSLDGFTVSQMPLSIDGIEDEYSSTPYLLSRDSLKLRNIVTQLRRSKNFRPLLHLGWRQPTVSRRRAVPLRIFAGENLQAHYQSAHELYLQDMAASREQEQALAQSLAGQTDIRDSTTGEEPTRDARQIIRERLNLQIQDILTQIATLEEPAPIPADENNVPAPQTDTALSDARLLGELNKPQMALEQSIEDFSEQLMLADAPQPPVQPWFLDGFFKVHVNHYLYITADFNIMNMSLAQQATQALAASGADTPTVKAINFKQNRRVISGEIHYFDHPYMGMIVQIRRYKRPEPPAPESEETQSE